MNLSNIGCDTIHFVYLGYPLPKYAVASLKLAKEYGGMKVHLLASKKNKKFIDSLLINFTALEDFYDNKIFEPSERNLLNDKNFLNGFWLKTLERFFVLSQFVKKNKLENFFHAELDQLLFGADELVLNIEKSQKSGIFIPFHSNTEAIASVFYCNNIHSLDSLLMTASTSGYRNEMELIAKCAQNNPNLFIALPTMVSKIIGSDIAKSKNIFELSPTVLGGVVDAAQVGAWIAGLDVFHTPMNQMPKTKFVEPLRDDLLSRQHLEKFKFQIDFEKNQLNIVFDNTFLIRIFNLHIHSKIHQSLVGPRSLLIQLFEEANQDKSVSLKAARKIHLKNILDRVFRNISSANKFSLMIKKILKVLKKKFNYLLGRRPSSYPYISGDTFRKIANFVWEKKIENVKPKNIKAGDIIFCKSDYLLDLESEILCKIDVPIVLLLGNSDINHNNCNQIKSRQKSVFEIYAQNLSDAISGWKVLPIGIENAFLSNHGKLSKKIIKQSSVIKNFFRVMCAFSIYTNVKERLPVAQELLTCSSVDIFQSLDSLSHQKSLQKYAFVVSPPGNGLDTHRTWEAFYFKCVPIVKRSYMTNIYETMGLPIWIVNSYEELKTMNEISLKEKYMTFVPNLNNPAIWADYWINEIKKSSETAKKIEK